MVLTDTNAYLTLEGSEQTANAQYIANWFLGKNWTKESISAMLGNMTHESTINFGIYESLDNTSSTNGFGLVQWTPNTNYFNWANSNGYSGDHINGELNMILMEVTTTDSNYEQWFATSSYNMTFQEFTQSTDTPSNLASAWYYDYERPASSDTSLPDRQTYANYWYTNLDWSGSGSGGTGGTGGTTSTNKDPIISMLLSDTLNGWKW